VIDTHAHLDMLEDADAAVERARSAGVKTILTVGIDRERWRRSLEVAARHDDVRVILGIHPHNAAGDTTVDELREAQQDPRVVAVGETGLDYYRDYAPRERQRELFEAQLELAAELDRPVVVHTRAADEDTVAELERHEGDVVLHCFSAPALLRPALENGWYVSFAGNVTYKNASELRVARSSPTRSPRSRKRAVTTRTSSRRRSTATLPAFSACCEHDAEEGAGPALPR
jgi:TatD DNase family protein